MRERKEAIEYCLTLGNAYEDYPFDDANWTVMRHRENKKTFALIFERQGNMWINVKGNPAELDFFRGVYEAVLPAYHQNKEHWNTIILDGSIPDQDVKRMIAESYDLVTTSPSKRIYEAVKKIPAGKVATYGQIAELAGDKKMARAVGNALHKNPDPEHIPCFRVVNAKGELSGAFAFGGKNVQADRLTADGVTVVDGRVDMERFGIKILDGEII